MKVLIFSDTHGNTDRVKEVLTTINFDHAIFLGDGIHDLKNFQNLEMMHVVRGNCDFFSTEKTEDFFEIDGIKFFITHGHEYGVRNGLGGLIKAGETIGAHVVCFGHTHQYLEEVVNGVTYLNPGSLSCVRGGKNTCALLETSNKNVKISRLNF